METGTTKTSFEKILERVSGTRELRPNESKSLSVLLEYYQDLNEHSIGEVANTITQLVNSTPAGQDFDRNALSLELSKHASPKPTPPEVSDIAVKRREKFFSDRQSSSPRKKAPLTRWGEMETLDRGFTALYAVSAAVSLISAVQGFSHSVTRDEEGHHHVQWGQMMWATVNTLFGTVMAMAAHQNLRGGMGR